MTRKSKLEPVRDIPACAVIIQAIHARGPVQQEALAELARRRLWLTLEQKREAGFTVLQAV